MVLVVALPRINYLVCFSVVILICSYVACTESVRSERASADSSPRPVSQDGAVQPGKTTDKKKTGTTTKKYVATTPRGNKKNQNGPNKLISSAPKKVELIGATTNDSKNTVQPKSQPSTTTPSSKRENLKIAPGTDESSATSGENGSSEDNVTTDVTSESDMFSPTARPLDSDEHVPTSATLGTNNDTSGAENKPPANNTSDTNIDTSVNVTSGAENKPPANNTSDANINTSVNVTSGTNTNSSANVTSGTEAESSDNATSTGTVDTVSGFSSREDANATQIPVAPLSGNTSSAEINATESSSTESTTSKPSPTSLQTCPDNFTMPSPDDLTFPNHLRKSTELTATWNFSAIVIDNTNFTIQAEKYHIFYYYFSCDSNGTITTGPASNTSSGDENVTITGLVIHTNYNICVIAVTNCGDSVPTCRNVTTNSGIPRKPSNINVTDVGPRSFRVSWIPAGDDPGPVQYEVCVYSTKGLNLKNLTTWVTGFKSNTTIIENLSPYTSYAVVIRANTSEGPSDWENGPSLLTATAVPGIPCNLTADNITSTSSIARWLPPTEYPGPTNYTVYVERQPIEFSAGGATFKELTHLKPFTEYSYCVSARTEAGKGNASATYRFKTKPSKPSVVKYLTGNCNTTMCTFYWQYPDRMNGKFEHFKVELRQGSHIVKLLKTANNSTTIPELAPNTNHTLTVTTKVEDVAEEGKPVSFSVSTAASPESSTAGVVASLTTLAVIGVIFGLVLLYLRWKNKLPHLGYLKRHYHQTSQTSETNMAIPFTATAKPVQLSEFEEHLRTMTADSGLKFSQEFEELNTISPACPSITAQLPENRAKNRWINILPFDHSRVKLLPIADDVSSDYINASYIPGHRSQREYIASQGPLPSTKDDFWRMIWEQNCTTIVVVTQLVERGKIKCEPYWPTNSDQHDFGDLLVSLKSEDVRNGYTMRVFTIQLKQKSFSRPGSSVDISDQTELIPQNYILDQGSRHMEIKQLHFTMWPDFGCPENTSTLINFVRSVRSAVTQSDHMGPILVHCSAGVGRTGTFIAVDIIMHHIQENDYVDVYGIVRAMRHYRSNMVQTEDQYVFIHECARDLIRELVPRKGEES